MNKTTHTVMTDRGEGHHVSVSHDDYAATQYEFYIPEAIWNHQAVRALLRRLETFASGATAFSRLSGVWDHKPETTRIYRMVLRAGQFAPAKTREILHDEIGRMMADLSADAGCAQDAFMFTETPVRVTMSGGAVGT
jgi:PHD/YefM family antitoxin component YafN of YafNO toxin-antitoxin module